MMMLGDDGTLDTVIVCGDCDTEFRFNFDGEGESEYHAFVEICKHDADANHACGVGYAHWASYLINGDRSGLDISNTPSNPDAGDRDVAQADAFAAWLGGYICDVKGESFFATPDAGGKLPGDCVYYIAYID